MTDRIVIGDRLLLDVGFPAIRDRLAALASRGMLSQASEVAYGEGITRLVQVAGPAAGLTRLSSARLDDVTETHGFAHVAFQWKAIAADGTLFTALDADLMLAPGADETTALSLAGEFRPQPGPAGAGLDPAIVRRCATAAIRCFLTRVACELAHPAGMAGPRTSLSRPSRAPCIRTTAAVSDQVCTPPRPRMSSSPPTCTCSTSPASRPRPTF